MSVERHARLFEGLVDSSGWILHRQAEIQPVRPGALGFLQNPFSTLTFID